MRMRVQYDNINYDNALALNRQQAITWTTYDIFLLIHIVSLCLRWVKL